MAQLVAMSAMLQCTCGAAPTPLTVLDPRVPCEAKPGANILDHKPMVNIMPFGTCKILTAAASGVPVPCVPATVAPWVPGSPTVLLRSAPALNNSSKCVCAIGGMISITSPGAMKEMVP